nr:glycosyltransferase [uncultured Anaerostipes sp.]
MRGKVVIKNISGKNVIIAVGIVLYCPDYGRLKESLIRLSLQFETIILYNNGANIKAINEMVSECKSTVIIVGDGENRGIATALNKIMEKANELNYKWVITLDQDSIVPDNMLPAFLSEIKRENVAIICSQNIDRRRKYMKPVMNPQYEYVKMCDTSGSCTNLQIWKELGGFDEWLFIDLVDNDYCKRVDIKGYKILRINTVVMDHQYGNIKPRGKLLEKFFLKMGQIFHNTNIAKLSFKRIVNPMRIYYENRNILYLNKKYRQYGGIGYANHHCRTYIGFFLTFSLYSWIVSDKKKEVYRAIRNGIKDGKRVNPKPWS